MTKQQLQVFGIHIKLIKHTENDYICISDIAKYKSDKSDLLIQNWMRNRNTLEFLGLWEKLYNQDFKPLEFEGFKKEAGLNAFLMSPKKWINSTNAIGIVSRSGKYGGTYAHKDIAIKFANWISVEFELYLIKEFQRLKEQESKNQDWNVKRFLTKMNYTIHTDAIKENLIPKFLSPQEISFIYADEADMLNKILFGMTAQEWRVLYPQNEGNMRDDATLEQLIVLANMESINSELIKMNMSQRERISLLSHTAISQMQSLLERGSKLLKG